MARTNHPNACVYADWVELLSREDVDIVDVVLRVTCTMRLRDGLESGRHLLLEKPMALTVSHCDELIALARTKGRVLAVGHELRLSSLWGKVKEMVDADAIGDPLYLLIELWRRPYRQGADGWRYDIGRVGNWILEEPIHFFDLARWYFASAGERRRSTPASSDNRPPRAAGQLQRPCSPSPAAAPSSRRRWRPTSTIRSSS
jgi:myo-inositol 2-dehydrogenase/D-chiro-inositol 1-dehydrogenase